MIHQSITALAIQADHGIRDSFIVRFAGDNTYDESAIAQEMAARCGVTLNIVEVDGDSVAVIWQMPPITAKVFPSTAI